MNYRWKKIWVSDKHFVIARVYKTKKAMRVAYKERKPSNSNIDRCLGVHFAYTNYKVTKTGEEKYKPETGTIFFNMENCGAGIVAHEFGHAVLWAHKHHLKKKQYPIVIKNMKQEEVILYNLTHAVKQFYNWYFDILKKRSA